MSEARVDVISIGTLARNLLWSETAQLRTGHATTSLIRNGRRTVLVDPALPPPALQARLHERTGLQPRQIDTVFLTSFQPEHRGGLSLFGHARVLVAPQERAAWEADLESMLDEAPPDDLDRDHFARDLDLLRSCAEAEDQVAESVDLFPLPGATAGCCGLLVAAPTLTILIAGAAVPTLDHFLRGQVLPDATDVARAKESLSEVYEIADLIVPGYDNLFLNPRSRGM